jgi:uncharacterized SAM-dependent methyltransferase
MPDYDGTNLGDSHVVRTTEKALLVQLESGEEMWIPKSVIHDDSEVYSEKANEGDLIVKTWWAEAQGLA